MLTAGARPSHLVAGLGRASDGSSSSSRDDTASGALSERQDEKGSKKNEGRTHRSGKVVQLSALRGTRQSASSPAPTSDDELTL